MDLWKVFVPLASGVYPNKGFPLKRPQKAQTFTAIEPVELWYQQQDSPISSRLFWEFRNAYKFEEQKKWIQWTAGQFFPIQLDFFLISKHF